MGKATASIASLETSAMTAERRKHRRHELGAAEIPVDRWEGGRRGGEPLGRIVDISVSGVRIRTNDSHIQPDHQIRLRLELPPYAGICPFVSTEGTNLSPKNEWVGWMAVSRVTKVDGREFEVAGRLMDMDDLDRGMLSLYLSTQPLAA
jgi:hypothetical protein